MISDLAPLADAVAAHGLALRGAFHPMAADGVPDGTGTLALVGNVGGSFWPPADLRDEPDSLDRWTRRVLDPVAARFGARALYPFGGPPHHPFQRWAQRAEPVYTSPLGILIHPDFGLWHAYRGALAFSGRLPLPVTDKRPNPCLSCIDKPCLSACPVGAFSAEAGYDVDGCAAHLRAPEGRPCREQGCLARHACPVGRNHAYEAGFAQFLMAAFERAQP